MNVLDTYSRYVVHWELMTSMTALDVRCVIQEALERTGAMERYQRSTREVLSEEGLTNLTCAREIIGRWVEYYNGERLYASLNYLPPAEYSEGDPEQRLQKPRENLERARVRREEINRRRVQAAA